MQNTILIVKIPVGSAKNKKLAIDTSNAKIT